MEQVIAHALASVPVAGGPAKHPMPTTIRDPALLLDIDVEQLSGPLALVAHHLAGGAVQLPQPRQLLATQDGMHRGGCLTKLQPIRWGPTRQRSRQAKIACCSG